MAITSRSFRYEDLLPCLEIDQRRIGDAIVGRERATMLWRCLTRESSFRGVVFECNPPLSGHQIIGFGCGVFVAPAFVAAELANPRPGLNDRLIASIDPRSSSVVLSDAKMRALNTHGTLDLVVLYANWLDSLINSRQRAEIQMMFALKMVEQFSGYRLRTVLCEEIGEVIRHFRESTCVWRLVQQFNGEDRGLICLTGQDALDVAGSSYGALFCYQEPKLKFRNGDKQLLIAATQGATDIQLTKILNISLASVKKRWRSVFDRVALKRPDLVPDQEERASPEKRGIQKRHIVLAYMREHPEELRPFEDSD